LESGTKRLFQENKEEQTSFTSSTYDAAKYDFADYFITINLQSTSVIRNDTNNAYNANNSHEATSGDVQTPACTLYALLFA